jgi:hypothetical protein
MAMLPDLDVVGRHLPPAGQRCRGWHACRVLPHASAIDRRLRGRSWLLRAAFTMAALDAGVGPGDVQLAARHADPRTNTTYDRRRQNFDRHAAHVGVAFVAGG